MPIIITRTVKIVIFSFLLLSTILLLIQKSYAKDISKSIENGQKKAAVCAACHGVNGNSVNPEWPSLANQSVKYMVEQLQHFKSGVRKNVLMSSQATNLSTEDMIDLSKAMEDLSKKLILTMESDKKMIDLDEYVADICCSISYFFRIPS